jgi:ABC-type iron transport system FetAB permease component
LTGIILGSVLNAAGITLDNLLGGLKRERATIEAQLVLAQLSDLRPWQPCATPA